VVRFIMPEGIRIFDEAPPPADARIPYGSNKNQFLDLRLPNSRERKPVVLFVHGGFWRAQYDLLHAGHVCAALTKAGIATLNLEYRRLNDGGGWPTTFDDVRKAWGHVHQRGGELAAEHGLDLNHVAVVGHSAGGQLALWLAARGAKLLAAVSLAGIIDLRRAYELHLSNDAVLELLGGTPEQVPERYRDADPARLKIRTEQVIVHGSKDDVVPAEIGRDYARDKNRKGEKAELLEIAGADHFALIDPESRSWPKVQEAILSLFG
jgi:acetyl esterase/lipase